MGEINSPVRVDGGKLFWGGASGRWAGEQLLRALQNNVPLTPQVLRTLDTLRKDEWIEFDEALVRAAVIRLRGVADLRALGLTRPARGGLGKTVFQWEKVTDMEPAQVSMDGMARTENDRQEFELSSLPLPIIHKDFFLNLRTLLASRERGETLDTTQIETAGRLIAERLELMLFQGGPTFAGLPIYGYTTHPNRNQQPFITNGAWDQAAKTGENILADVLAAIGKLEADRMYGPYGLYVPSGFSLHLEEDFKANSDKTIRQRLLEVDRLQFINVADQCPANKCVLVQLTPDVITLVDGEPLQTIQWDIQGGFQINFKGFMMSVPLIRVDSEERCGVCIIGEGS
jgi:uncharacterized linocin/CFP29 family protein